MEIKELIKKLGFEKVGDFDEYAANLFGLKSADGYRNSSAKKRYETALCRFYLRVTQAQAKEKKECDNQKTVNEPH